MDKILRAAEAQSLLENELFISAFTDTRNKIIDQIERCDIKDDVLRDKLMLSLQLLKRIRGTLIDHVNTGKLAENVLERQSVFNRKGL